MKQLIEVCVAVILIALSGVGSFIYGQQQGYSKGYSHGHDIGWEDAKKNYNVDDPPKTYFFEYENLKGDYDKLVKDYNSLAAYANAPKKQSLSCTSNTIGSYAYTNCY